MAEFCKECFVKTLLPSEEQRNYIDGKLEIIETDYNDFCEGCCRNIPVVLEVKENTENTEEDFPKRVMVEKSLLQRTIDYVNAVLEALDIEDEELLNHFNEGYDNIIKPLEDLTFGENNEVDEFVIAKQINVDTFKENLENIYNVDTPDLSDEEVAKILEEVEDMLAGDDEYNEAYNNAVE